ncbi:hypothetical protein BLOT_008229 [Blomia tropicalis]|nr:hypothetical protein BLOT_008229 [Blomia tropicalis]
MAMATLTAVGTLASIPSVFSYLVNYMIQLSSASIYLAKLEYNSTKVDNDDDDDDDDDEYEHLSSYFQCSK